MSVRVRPNRLGYLVAALATFTLGFYLVSSSHFLFSDAQLRAWDSLPIDDASLWNKESENGGEVPLILEDMHHKADLQEQGLRITLAQLYENARLDHLGLDEEMGEHEVEGHEDYIYRLSKFVGDYFEGSPAQRYLRKMLSNLNLHISPPLLKSGVRRGAIRIVKGNKPGVKGVIKKGKGDAMERMQAIEREGGWEPNVWNAGELNRASSILSKGSELLGAMWSNMTRFEEQKIVVKYLALLLWGGAFTESQESMMPIRKLTEMIESSTSVTPPSISGPRSSLQPMAPRAPFPPRFIPPSLDPNWTRYGQSSSEREIGIVVTRSSDGIQGRILTSDIVIAKAFHPVFLDLVSNIAHRTELEFVRLKSDGEKFDSSVLNLDDNLLLNEAVDKYLRVQYASSLADIDRLAGDEAVRMGDVLLLPSPGPHA